MDEIKNEKQEMSEVLADLTPTQYFDMLTGMKKDITEEDIQNVLNNCVELMKKPKITGQKKMAKKIYEQSQILLRELTAVKAGFTTYVLREDILYYIERIAKKTVKIIELENYERDIPDEVIDKLVEAQPLFDEFFIIFTDYTGEVERTVKKEERDKDPILFGVVHHPDKTNMPTNRMYFIADWVDEYCDLTLEELCMQYEGNMKRGITHTNKIPTTLEELKEMFEIQESESKIRTIDEISQSIVVGSSHNINTKPEAKELEKAKTDSKKKPKTKTSDNKVKKDNKKTKK